jgi:hypothetical protein
VDGDVTDERDTPFPEVPGSGQQTFGVDVERYDIPAFTQEPLHYGEADALRRTGDDDALASETRHADSKRG